MKAGTEVLELEKAFWLIGGGNPDFWREHCAGDAIIALPMGIMGKDDTLAQIEGSPPWQKVRFHGIRAVETGGTVIVSYRATGQARGAAAEYEAVVSSAYARRDGKWQLVFHQQSPTE